MMGLSLLFQDLCTVSYNFWILILIVFVTLLFMLFEQIKKKKEEREELTQKLPPGPKRIPLVGNLHQFVGIPYRSLNRLSCKYGPLMFLKLGSIPTLVVSSADVAKEIFETHDLVFSSRPRLYAANKLTYGSSDIAFSPYGEYWREVRKIAILELLSVKRVRSFQTVREEELANVIDLIKESSSSLIPVCFSDIMLSLVNSVVCRVAFGRKYDEEGGSTEKSKFRRTLLETQELLSGFHIADFFPWMGWIHKFDGLNTKLENNFNQLDSFYDKVIDEHLDHQRPNPELEDLVDVLLRVHKDPHQKINLTRNQIKAVLTDIFIAGTDPASATLIWTMTELIRNPTVMRRAQEEVRMVVGGKKDFVQEGDLPKLNYLNLVIKESMRLHPPAPLPAPRETTEDCTINGYTIPAKTRVFVNVKSISMDRKYWEEPEEFRPERFLDNVIDFKGKKFEFIPFGAGRRGCPGANFAVLLMELVLANLLHCFDWELPPGAEVDMKEAAGLTMHKKSPLYLLATNACKNALVKSIAFIPSASPVLRMKKGIRLSVVLIFYVFVVISYVVMHGLQPP